MVLVRPSKKIVEHLVTERGFWERIGIEIFLGKGGEESGSEGE